MAVSQSAQSPIGDYSRISNQQADPLPISLIPGELAADFLATLRINSIDFQLQEFTAVVLEVLQANRMNG